MAAVSLMPCHSTHLSKRLWESSKKCMPCYSESQGFLFPSVAAWLNDYYLALCKHELMNPHTALRLWFSAPLMWEKAGLEQSLLCLLLQLWWPGKLQDCNALIEVKSEKPNWKRQVCCSGTTGRKKLRVPWILFLLKQVIGKVIKW